MTAVYSYADQLESNLIKLWVDLSTHCNARCPQCHRTNPNGLTTAEWLPLVSWSLEQFKQAFPPSVINSSSEVQICGTWGDPLMNKDIGEICKYIVACNPRTYITINTNGSIRDEAWWWDFGVATRGRCQVYWAIDGVDQAQHGTYRRGTELKKILRNMESYSAAGGRSKVFTVVFDHNDKDLFLIADMCKDYGAEEIVFVKSNRLYKRDVYNFVDELGKQQALHPSNISDNTGIFWRSLDLTDPKDMERIARATTTKEQV